MLYPILISALPTEGLELLLQGKAVDLVEILMTMDDQANELLQHPYLKHQAVLLLDRLQSYAQQREQEQDQQEIVVIAEQKPPPPPWWPRQPTTGGPGADFIKA